MLTPEMLQLLFQYNLWADRRTLDACAALTSEQFTRDLGSDSGSVRDTLAHMFGAEWAWNERMEGRIPSGLPGGVTLPDFGAVRAKLEEMDLRYIDLTSTLKAQDLQRVLHYKNFAGEEYATPLWQILHQLSNHATYHRGQVAKQLRLLGAKAVSTDLIGYYREQAARASA
jgi:uncharacterized damage-inducible protein DinB